MTCLETYADLRVFSEDIHPDEINKIIGIDSSSSVPRDLNSKYKPRREFNFWSKTTNKVVSSADNLVHLSFIIELLKDKEDNLNSLRSKGCSIDIYCYWDSNGQGGPQLSCGVMESLVSLGLDISWQVYFVDEDEESA